MGKHNLNEIISNVIVDNILTIWWSLLIIICLTAHMTLMEHLLSLMNLQSYFNIGRVFSMPYFNIATLGIKLKQEREIVMIIITVIILIIINLPKNHHRLFFTQLKDRYTIYTYKNHFKIKWLRGARFADSKSYYTN